MAEQSLEGVRIALFCGNYNYTRDGANLVLNRWVRHLESHGCTVRVYSPESGAAAFTPAGSLVAVPAVSIPWRTEYRLALGLGASGRADLARFRPELVHVSTPDLLGLQATSLARACSLPVVGSYHTRFETYLRYYGLGALEPLLRMAIHDFYRRCDYVLAPSPAVARELASRRSDGVRLWGRGVDRQLFEPCRRSSPWRAAHGFAETDMVVLFFGRLVREKGLAVFAQAVQRAAALDSRVRALVVGAGPARDWFARRLPGAVFTGCLAGEALATAVASADLLFNPSSTEAFSNVTLEAMACGLPVVVADVPVQRDLVTDAAGLMCPSDDVVAYRDAILRLCAEPLLLQRLANGARAESERYDWRDVLSRGVAVYREALALGCGDRGRRVTPAATGANAAQDPTDCAELQRHGLVRDARERALEG